MKRLLIISVLFVTCSPAWATWTLLQHKVSSACTVTSITCAITVTSTGAGNVIIIGFSANSSTQAIVSVSGGGTYTHPACNATASTTKGTDCAYTLSSTSGATSITVTRTNTTSVNWAVAATEFSFTAGAVAIDAATPIIRSQASATTSPAGATVSPAGSNDVIYQIIAGNTVTAVSSPYSTNVDFQGNTGFAIVINTLTGTAPTWTQTSSVAALAAIAFTETSGVTIGFDKRRKLQRLQTF